MLIGDRLISLLSPLFYAILLIICIVGFAEPEFFVGRVMKDVQVAFSRTAGPLGERGHIAQIQGVALNRPVAQVGDIGVVENGGVEGRNSLLAVPCQRRSRVRATRPIYACRNRCAGRSKSARPRVHEQPTVSDVISEVGKTSSKHDGRAAHGAARVDRRHAESSFFHVVELEAGVNTRPRAHDIHESYRGWSARQGVGSQPDASRCFLNATLFTYGCVR